MSYSVGQVAGFAGVTVRTGLLVPSERSHAGHRRHSDADLDRLHECPHEMYTCLAGMYVGDARFKEHDDGMRPGFAEHLREAILANAARHAS